MTLPFAYFIAPEQRRSIPAVVKAPEIDGKLKDWEELPYHFSGEDAESLQVDWGIQRDEDNIYIAAKVTDNSIRVQKGLSTYQQDYIGVVVNAEPMATGAMRKGEGSYRNSYILAVSPETKTVEMTTLYQDRYPFTTPFKCQPTEDGYVLEMALPLSYVREVQGDNWRHVRINIAVLDWDEGSDKKPMYYWRPDWRGEKNQIGSGLFFKE
jgi:hypothetical protein